MNEWAKVAIDELDFKAEAANQKQVAANLARTNIGVKVPALTVLNGVELVSSKVRRSVFFFAFLFGHM